MKSAYDKIAAGLADAIAYKKGDTTRGRVAKPSTAALDVKIIRSKTKLSQARFADTYHLPVATVRDWEQQRRTPDSGSAVYLKMIEADPKAVEAIVAKIDV